MTEDSKPRTRRASKTEAVEAEAAVVEEAPKPAKPAPKATPSTVQVASELRFKRRMSQGDHGPAVAEIQRMLAAKGLFEGRQDGRYGTLLGKAVRQFQGSQGLKVNGEVDILTWEALNK